MRFLHTSDWHLGRLFHGVHLTEDQSHVLDQLVDLVKESRVDAVVIAGDIYDRAVPPPEAVTLLDDVLSRIVVGLDVPVLMIAGNHDSPERIGFGSRVLSQQKVHVAGTLSSDINSVVLTDSHGPVQFYLIPYAEPALVREKFADAEATDHSSGMKALVGQCRSIHPAGARSVVVAHAFVAGGEESESERPLSVGGSGAVDASLFGGFNYVALGHLHRPQQAGGDNITYSGSLMKYSFSEADHRKCLQLVEIDRNGKAAIEQISLSPRRDVRRMEGTLAQILSGAVNGGSKDDYLEITLLDKGALLDPIGKLREIYPNVLHLRRPEFMSSADLQESRSDHRKINDLDLFRNFFAEVTGEQLTNEQTDTYKAAMEQLALQDREATN